ncbi:ShlB/FhaC/HecB family hemolysin secretion/activation protein [Vibrio cholerae]
MANLRWLLSLIYLFSDIGLPYTGFASEPPLIVLPEKNLSPTTNSNSLPTLSSDAVPESTDLITSIHFRGGTSFNLDMMAEYVTPLIGQVYDSEMVLAAVNKISERLQRAGYPLSFSTVGSNGFTNGQLTITVIEGYVVRTEILVEDPVVVERIEKIVSPVLNQRPGRSSEIERAIALIHRIPGYQFEINLPRPKTISGATSLQIKAVNKRNFEPFAQYSMQQKGERNAAIGITFTPNRWFMDDMRLVGLLPMSDEDKRFYSASFAHTLGNQGFNSRLDLTYYSDQEASKLPLNEFDIEVSNSLKRQSILYSMAYPLLLSSSRQMNIVFSLLFEEEQGEYEFSLNNQHLGKFSEDIKYWFASAKLESTQNWDSLTLGYQLGVHKSVDSLFSYRSNMFADAPYEDNMHYVDLFASVHYRLTPTLSLEARAEGIYSERQLVPSQRASYGGLNYGRAYEEGIIEGYKGFGAEVKATHSQSFGLVSIGPFILWDYAEVTNDHLHSPVSRISSAAVGLGLSYKTHFYVSFDYANPLQNLDGLATQGVWNFRVSWEF